MVFEHLSTVERLEKIIAAGVDMIGGESLSPRTCQ